MPQSLVITNGTKNVPDLGLKATFAGRTSPDETRNPKTIFACQADSIKAVEEAVRKNVLLYAIFELYSANFESNYSTGNLGYVCGDYTAA